MFHFDHLNQALRLASLQGPLVCSTATKIIRMISCWAGIAQVGLNACTHPSLLSPFAKLCQASIDAWLCEQVEIRVLWETVARRAGMMTIRNQRPLESTHQALCEYPAVCSFNIGWFLPYVKVWHCGLVLYIFLPYWICGWTYSYIYIAVLGACVHMCYLDLGLNAYHVSATLGLHFSIVISANLIACSKHACELTFMTVVLHTCSVHLVACRWQCYRWNHHSVTV